MLNIFCCSKCRNGKDRHSTQQADGHSDSQGNLSPELLNDCLQGINGNGRMSDAWITVTSSNDTDRDNNAKDDRTKKAARHRLSIQSGSPFRGRFQDNSAYSIREGNQIRPKSLNWALPKPTQEGLRIGQITSLDGYDTDAEVILTPAVSQPQSDADVGDSCKGPGTEAELRSERIINRSRPVAKEIVLEQPGKRVIDTQKPKNQQLCNNKSVKSSRDTSKAKSNSVPLRLPPNPPSSDCPRPVVTFAQEPLKHRRVPVRKPLPFRDPYNSAPLEPSKEPPPEPDSAALGGAHCSLQDKEDHNDLKIQGGGGVEHEARYSVKINIGQGSSENVPPGADSLSTILIPPKSPSRSASSSSQSEATRRQLRAVSSSSYTGDCNFRYFGPDRPQVQQHVNVPKTRKPQQPRKSRFREEFHISKPPSVETGFDGNEDRPPGPPAQSLRRRVQELGIMPHSDEAAALWERALASHAKDVSNQRNNPYSPFKGNLWSTSRRNFAQSQLDTSKGEKPGRKRLLSVDSAEIAPDVVVCNGATRQTLPQKDRPQDTWTRYPSHTRSDRTSSAGSQDHVSTWDFAREHEASTRARSMIERTKKKRAPLLGSRNFFDIVKDRWVNERSDLLRLEKGFRSSVSVGGELKYPDLELLPNMEPAHLAPPNKRDISSNFSNPVSSGDSALDDAAHATSPKSDVTAIPNDARVWSQVYRACVPGAPYSTEFRSEGDQPAGSTGGLLSPTYVPRRAWKAVSPAGRSTHSDTALDVRNSTVDFSESLHLKLELCRKSLFDAIGRMEIGGSDNDLRK